MSTQSLLPVRDTYDLGCGSIPVRLCYCTANPYCNGSAGSSISESDAAQAVMMAAQVVHAPDCTTADTAPAADIVVLLLCGLPASGKSALASAFCSAEITSQSTTTDNDDIVTHHIEYDQLQDALQNDNQRLLENQDATVTGSGNDDKARGTSSSVLAWRQSRASALDELRDHLQQQQQQQNGKKTGVILMDDNFYLRSMRKQVYQVCRQQQQQAASALRDTTACAPMSIYFGIVWFDTPVDVCLERNRHRTSKRMLPDEIIQRMNERFEVPGHGTPLIPSWEQGASVLRLDGTVDLQVNLHRLRDFVQLQICGATTSPVPPPVDPAVEEQRVRAAQLETQQSVKHAADQFWRQCVAATAQLNRSSAGMANRVRKHCLHQQASSTTITVDRRAWLGMFLNGLPGDNTWLSDTEKEALCCRFK